MTRPVPASVPPPAGSPAELELDVAAVGHGGFCVARHEGRVVFVRHALPGERVLARVTDDSHDTYWRADAVQVLRASPDRVPPPCPVARAGGCGGCDWQHATPDRQRQLKADVVTEQLRRIARLEPDPIVVEPLPGGPLGWRTRVQLAVGADGRAGLRAHREQRVVPLADCPITVPGVLPPILARRWRPGSTVEVTVDAGGEVHVAEHASRTAPDRPAVLTDQSIVQWAAGRPWRLSAGAFWQVHPAAADTFATVVGEFAQAPPGGLAWDLYGGVGLFAAVLAGQVGAAGDGGEVVVVESSRAAAADGMANLTDLPNVRFVVGRVERALDQLPGRPDVVVLDPPRRGAGKAVAAAVAARTPARIVHVACDPAALARDVATFDGHGYRLAALRAFDAFPMTHHVECIALLVRAGS